MRGRRPRAEHGGSKRTWVKEEGRKREALTGDWRVHSFAIHSHVSNLWCVRLQLGAA